MTTAISDFNFAEAQPDLYQLLLLVFNKQPDARLVFHNFAFVCNLVETVYTISESEKLDENRKVVVIYAAVFRGISYTFPADHTKLETLRLAEQYMREKNLPPELQSRVFNVLSQNFDKESGQQLESKILNDAIQANHFGESFREQYPLWRLESEFLKKQTWTKQSWMTYCLQQILKTKYYTGTAKKIYEPVLADHLLFLKTEVEKQGKPWQEEDNWQPRKFQQIEKKIPSSAIQTFFRANYRNHINLSSIADGKANIMISVNAILISVIISAVSYRNIIETQPEILMPAIIFIVMGLTSLVFAVLSARPKVTNVIADKFDLKKAKRNLVFFGNFVQMDIDQYETAMDEMLREGELIYGNMTRDLYHLGLVLHQKYRYLSISYNVFMVGFVATVLAFLITMFF